MKPTPRLLAALVASHLFSYPAGATPFAEVVSQSALGEPFHVELRLGRDANAADMAECLRIVDRSDDADGLPWLGSGRISVVGSGPTARIAITNATPVFDPIVRFAVEDVCQSRLRRAYTLLLAYPETPTAAVADLTASPPPQAAPAAPPQRKASPSTPAMQTWITAPGESVESLAHALFPKDTQARRRFVRDTLAANRNIADPAAPLPPGTEIGIPDPNRPPARPAQATREPGRSAGKPAVAAQPAPAKRAAAAPPPAAEPKTDRLMVEADEAGSIDQGLRLSAELFSIDRSASTTEIERDLLRREQQLVMALDRLTATQLALQDRIRKLEEIEAALTERAITLGAVPSPAPQEPPIAAPPPAPEAAKTSDGWLLPLALFGGVAGALGLALVGVRRYREHEDSSADAEIATATGFSAAEGVQQPSPADRQDAVEPRGDSERVHREPILEPTASPAGDKLRTLPAPFSVMEWGKNSAGLSGPDTVAPIVVDEDVGEEHDSAIELAEIMVSFGRVQGAAETLAEFIRSNPKQAVTPWLKLLEVYRMAGLRPEFDGLARQLNKTFNVKAVTWDNFDQAKQSTDSLEQMPHILETLEKTWRTRECQAYLQKLLRDNRDGSRQGFPLPVIDEILMLTAVLEQELGPYRPEHGVPPPQPPSGGERQAA